jgi:hypothetical protein
MTDIRLPFTRSGTAQTNFLAVCAYLSQQSSGAGLYIPQVKLIGEGFAHTVVSNNPARQHMELGMLTKAASAAFVARASVIPRCGMLEV